MTKYVLEIFSAEHLPSQLHQITTDSITIGRGYNNDVILSDPFVSAKHVTMEVVQGGWQILDHDSRNGVFVRNSPKPSKTALLLSGDFFRIGKTRIRVWAADTPVPLAYKIPTGKAFLQMINNREHAFYAITGFILVSVLNVFAQSPQAYHTKAQVIAVVFASLIGLSVWAGFWAGLGMMIRRRGKFLFHLTIAALVVMLSLIVENVRTFVLFNVGDIKVAVGVSLLIAALLFGLLFCWHLLVATLLSFRKVILYSFVIPGVIFLMIGIAFFSREKNNWYFSSELKPVFLKIAPSQSIDDFLSKIR